VKHLRGHFDGQGIVLDKPVPPELKPDTPVEIIIAAEPEEVSSQRREELLREYMAFMEELWARPLPPDFEPKGRQWKREDCYERGRKSAE
jgi:hypothetical protein